MRQLHKVSARTATGAWGLAVVLVGVRVVTGGPVAPVWFWPTLALALSVAVTMTMIAAMSRALPSVVDVFAAGAEWGAEGDVPPRRHLRPVH